jgi:hypothetical protein
MLSVRPTRLTASPYRGQSLVTAQDGGTGPAVGWRVLALLQFLAAGSLVLALAARVFFPHGFRNAFVQSSPGRATLGVHRVVCVGYQWPGGHSRVSKNRPLAVFRPPTFEARLSRQARSPVFFSYSAAPDARAPPGGTFHLR